MTEKVKVTHPAIQRIVDNERLTRGIKIQKLMELYRKEKDTQGLAMDGEPLELTDHNARLRYIQLALEAYGIDILRIEEGMLVSKK